MASEECLSKVASFIQEKKAMRSLCKCTRPDEPVLPDIFTWISHELFNDIEHKPIALRHAIQKHILTSRKDITEILIDMYSGSGQNANKQLEAIQNQVLDTQYDNANSVIYFYCLATFFDLDIYVVNSEGTDEFRWDEYKSLKLLNIKQEIDYSKKTHKFDVNRTKQPGILMTYMHMDANGLNMYIIRSQISPPERPKCQGMVELAARQLKCTPLDSIAVPNSLVADVQKNAAQLPKKCQRIRFWVAELCRETGCSNIYERHIEVPNEDSWSEIKVLCSDNKLHLKLIQHLSAGPSDHVLTFCRILLRRCEFEIQEGLSDQFKSLSIPLKHKYSVLSNFETELGNFNVAISIGTKTSDLQERRGRVNNVVIGTSISGIVGGILGVVGLALIPVTFGVSLGLTIAGGVIGTSSGFLQGGFRVHEAFKQNQSTAQIRETLEKARGDFEKALRDFTSEFNLDTIGNSGPESPGLNIRGTLTIGALLRTVHSGLGIGFAAAKVGATAATAAAAVLAPVGLLLDVGFMTEAIYGKATGNHTEAGRKLECLRVFQTIVNATYRGNADFNTKIVERIMQND